LFHEIIGDEPEQSVVIVVAILGMWKL